MSDTKRTYKQYITLDLEFDEPQAPDNVWRTLYTNGVAVRSGGQNDFTHKNFNAVQTKKVIRFSSPLSVNTVDLGYMDDDVKKVLDTLIPNMWSKETITLEDDSNEARIFKPMSFAVSAKSIANSDMTYWWNQTKDWYNDLRYSDAVEAGTLNIYNFQVSCNRTSDGYINSLQFKMWLGTENQKLFNANETQLNDYVLGHILKACLAVGTYQHAFSCAGEIEVEKAVSCARFNRNNVVIGDEEE